MLLETRYRSFDPFGVGTHLLTDLGELVPGGMPEKEPTTERSLQRCETPMYGRLAQAKRLRSRQRAAALGDRQEVTKVVPVKHEMSYAILGNYEQYCACLAAIPSGY